MLGVVVLAVAGFQGPGYLNPSLPPKQRAADLTSRMTLDEKISQMQNEAEGIPRLGIPAYNWWSEALHGAVGSPVTVYPQVIGLAATFDQSLTGRIGAAISDEGRARYEDAAAHNRHGMHEGLTFWAPNINIFRDPRWGRGQETYGEDPFLTASMAVPYVKNLQGESSDGRLKAISTPKHYAVHSGPDPDRHRFNAIPDPRDLWNTYLPAFQACVERAGAWSVMSAYSSVNGVPDSANSMLLQQILRDDWGFRGYVVSDCGAIYDIQSGHHYTSTLAQAAADAVKAGCDLECGDAYKHLKEAVQEGLIDEKTIDKSVDRLMEARIRLGMFDQDHTGPWAKVPMSVIDSQPHKDLALEAARKSLVLLKNDGFLPLRNVRKLAVIGPIADNRSIPLGNYNGLPSHTASVLEGIRKAAPAGVEVSYDPGSDLMEGLNTTPVPETYLKGGVRGQYFSGENLGGASIFSATTPTIDFDWGNGSPDPSVPQTHFSARYETTLIPPVTGDYQIGTRSDDGARLKIDGKTVEEDWTVHPAKTTTATVHLEAGHSYSVVVEYFQAEGEASVSMVWGMPKRRDFQDALTLANSSDAVAMVLGISGDIENEEHDRTSIELPAVQQHLLKAVLGTGKPVVVVLESGSCISLDPRPLRGLIEAWYPGESGGTAVGEVLFGKTNPSGRLPVTFYKSLDQVPTFTDYKMAGRTYRYLTQKPLYPFGFGLSYTKFRYRLLSVSQLKPGHQDVALEVANTGDMDGDEVVQVYSARDGAAWPEPLRKLYAFKRVHVPAHSFVTVHMPVDPSAATVNDANGKPMVVHGEYTITIGGGQPGAVPTTSGAPIVLHQRFEALR